MNRNKILLAVLGLAAFISMYSCLKTEEAEAMAAEDVNQGKVKNLVLKSHLYLLEGKYDSAQAVADLADNINQSQSNQYPAQLLEDIKLLRSKEFQESVLVSLTESDYKLLKKNSFTEPFFTNDTLNTAFLSVIHQRESERPTLLKAKEKEEKLAREREVKEAIATRETAVPIMRNAFLDMGLDIEVSVKGKNKDHLYLQYSLFGDVWFRKFETEGLFNQYHQMGFKKVTLTDGYDYNKYMYWK